MRTTALAASFVLACLLDSGCLGERCSPGQVLREGACAIVADGAVGDGRDGGRHDAESDSAGFGASCKSSTECTGKTDYCIVMPASPIGYCTARGCAPGQLGVCPASYTCVDLSKFLPGLPTACLRL